MIKEMAMRAFTRIAVVCVFATVAIYLLRIRDRIDRWGASDEEVARSMPGDSLVPEPHLQTTRAVTIQAPVAAVFPWLAQMGQGRGGFYSYDWLENNPVQRLGIHSADRILPEFQDLRIGDQIPVAPGPPFYGFLVADVAAPDTLVLEMRMHPLSGAQQGPGEGGASLHATWTFVLEPTGHSSTRLIARTRAHVGLPAGFRMVYCLVLEAAMFAMERGMMRGIRERAERQRTAVGFQLRSVAQAAQPSSREPELAAASMA